MWKHVDWPHAFNFREFFFRAATFPQPSADAGVSVINVKLLRKSHAKNWQSYRLVGYRCFYPILEFFGVESKPVWFT